VPEHGPGSRLVEVHLSAPAWTSLLRGSVRVQLCVLALALFGCRGTSSTQTLDSDPAPFYRGRALRIIVGVSPGGGQDLYARIMAAHLSRHLPGRPNVIVDNKPGAGGLIAANYMARQANPDGLTIGLLGVQAVVAQLLGNTPQFDIRDLPIIGSPADDGAVCAFTRASGFSLDAWRGGRVARLGMTNRGSTTASYAFLVSEALVLPIRPVIGYAGTSEIKSAMANGEVDGACMSRNSYVASFQAADNSHAVLQAGGDAGTSLPDVPAAETLATTDRGRSFLAIVSRVGVLARYYALPPGTPDAQIQSMRTAFDLTMKDSAFLEAAHAAHLEIRPQAASTVSASVEGLLTLPLDIRREIIALLNEGPL